MTQTSSLWLAPKRVMSLLWKEWRETRAFLWIAMGIFIGLPLIDGIERHYQTTHHFEMFASPWVLVLGGVLACFAAVGATCRDFSGRLEDFWRSRPFSIVDWLLVKYFTGLIVLLAGCVLPLIIERWINGQLTLPSAFWHPFIWTALYSIAFLVGCLVRRTAHAGMLALAAMLLVYFLPVVIPPLQWLNIAKLDDYSTELNVPWHLWGSPQLAFAGGMLFIAIAALLLSLVAVCRNWQIAAGRKLIYGSIATAILILFSSAAFQLGTNMPVLRQIDLPRGETVLDVHYSDSGSYIITYSFDAGPGSQRLLFRSLTLSDSGIQLGSPVAVAQAFSARDRGFFHQEHSVVDPKIVYYIHSVENFRHVRMDLNVAQVDKPIDVPVLKFWEGEAPTALIWPVLYATRDKLYVIGPRLITLDITQPLSPRVISDVPFGYSPGLLRYESTERITIILPRIPELSAKERLLAMIKDLGTFENDILCRWTSDNTMVAYHLGQLTESKATLEKIGQYQPSILDNIFGDSGEDDEQLQHGLLYFSQGRPNTWANPHIAVFDTRGAHPMRSIAHFAAPGIQTVSPLPDGTAIVGGDKLWLIGPPPQK